mgnify:CR=1 FL=1
MKNYVKLLEQFLEENKIQLPTWLFDDPEDFEDWFENGMELEKGKIAPFLSQNKGKISPFL